MKQNTNYCRTVFATLLSFVFLALAPNLLAYAGPRFQEGFATVELHGRKVVIDMKGNIVFESRWSNFRSLLGISDGLFRVDIDRERGFYYGFVDKTGNEVIPTVWGDAHYFREGLAAVSMPSNNDDPLPKWGFIDREGKIVIDLEWDRVTSFAGGVAVVQRGRKYGAINKTGEIVIPLEWDGCEPPHPETTGFNEGLANVKRGDKWGFIDTSGNIVIEPQWKFAGAFSEGLAKVGDAAHAYDKEGKYGFIDKTGNVVIPIELTGDLIGDLVGGMIVVRRNGKAGYLNSKGEEVVPVKFDMNWAATEGLGAVNQGRTWGYVNPAGEVAIPIEWDYASPFGQGLGYVAKGDFEGFIDKEGKVVIDLADTARQLAPSFPIPERQWTNNEGNQIKAEALRIEGRNVIFKMPDREVAYPISSLSPADQEFLNKAGAEGR